MLSRSFAAGLDGVHGYLITVESDVRRGLPGLTVVGRATGAVGEARERVRSAMAYCGHELKPRRQIVNLAPADRRKDSPGIDLSVACALLASHGVIPKEALDDVMLWGELALDGTLRPAAGTLVVSDCARRAGLKQVAVATASAGEASLIPGVEVLAVQHLPQLVAHLRGETRLTPFRGEAAPAVGPADHEPDMADVIGQASGRMAVEVMVAGGHNLLLHGSPGVGKTMLARRAGGLLPDLDPAQALEVTKVHSLASGRIPVRLHRRPPVRMPHHSVSPGGLLGGGSPPRPGEVSLAHHGLLFLDELLEFPRACIEGLREPLEQGSMSIVRAAHSVHFPARFQLMAAMNPCPCGYLGHPERACVDSAAAVSRYQHKLSGPLLDRLDLVVPLHSPSAQSLRNQTRPETSAVVRERITLALARQAHRLKDHPWRNNAQIPAEGGAIDLLCPMTASAEKMLATLVVRRQLSLRAQHRLRRVARTIADLHRDDAGVHAPVDDRELAGAATLRRMPDHSL